MSTALTAPNPGKIALPEAVESALINGDLSKLDVPGRLHYYKAVCESLGLNPLTKPFEYITLNGKLKLYACRDCTDQLRRIYSVSITSLQPNQMGDLFVVVAAARDAQGRIDSSTGAVNTKGLQGENLANAMMKCETKAKRRVTLSLCGLGLLDETEVEAIREQEPMQPQLPAPSVLPPAPAQATVTTPKIKGNVLTVHVLNVEQRQSRAKLPKPFMAVKFAGQVKGKSMLFCWHQSLSEALTKAVGNTCQFEIDDDGDYMNILNVLDVSGQEYRDGKPYFENQDAEPTTNATANPEITNADLPESLFAE